MTNKENHNMELAMKALDSMDKLATHIPNCNECIEALGQHKNLCLLHLKLCTKAIYDKQAVISCINTEAKPVGNGELHQLKKNI